MSQSKILVVEDDLNLREALCETLELAGYAVATAADGMAALEILGQQTDTGLVISDVQMQPMDGQTLLRQIKLRHPELPVLLMTAYGTVQSAVEAMRIGAVDYLVKPFEAEVLVKKVARYMAPEAANDDELIAIDPKSRDIVALAARVAMSDVTVMISGESGTGKEVLARHLHRKSRRAAKPFIAINCAAIPENMLEATLFGYEKGAFTGAVQACPGKFEQSQGGTLLLDEISEMDLALQAKLLRVLQEREVERLGSRKLISLDVRVLATTNRVLREEVAAGRFREDLFYRLNVFPLQIAPLRERPLDILPLAQRALRRAAGAARRVCPVFSAAARERLESHSWLGNVRELDNLIQRALILQAGEMIEVADLCFEPEAAAFSPACPDSLDHDLKSREQQLILEALNGGQGGRKRAADRLGISQRTLRYKLARMREAGIAVPG